ncbi:MAG: protein translocase subunit SecF [Clostridiaceae bacterium]
MLKIIEKAKLWFAISLIIIIIGAGFAAVKGFNIGIDFKGGNIVVVDMGGKFDKTKADNIVKKYDKTANTNTSDETEYEIKSGSMTTDQISSMFSDLKKEFNLKDAALISQDYIGGSIGKETAQKAIWSIIIATICMLIYVGIRFEFKFGIAAIIALVHDVLITLAVYAVLQIPLNASFVAAMLTIIGYSINDTIVVFDRIRENVKKTRKPDFTQVADISITQTMTRSLYTVLTTLFTIVAVNIFVPTVREFSIPLIIGIISGCYSSIFIASPLWVIFKSKKKAAVK